VTVTGTAAHFAGDSHPADPAVRLGTVTAGGLPLSRPLECRKLRHGDSHQDRFGIQW
jgi:hypothetical protein